MSDDLRHPCAPPRREPRLISVEIVNRETVDDWADEIKRQEEEAQAAREASYPEGG